MAIRERISILASKHVKLRDSVKLFLGDGSNAENGDVGDISVAWDGTDLDVLQATANSSIKWGVDGAGIDQVWYGDTASASMTWDQSADALILAGVASLASYRVKTITGSGAVSVNAAQSGGYFYATGAATFTLPALADGLIFTFLNLTDANMAITSPGDNLVYKNDTFTTVTYSTANEKKGAMATVICNGTNYYLFDGCAPSFAVGGTGS